MKLSILSFHIFVTVSTFINNYTTSDPWDCDHINRNDTTILLPTNITSVCFVQYNEVNPVVSENQFHQRFGRIISYFNTYKLRGSTIESEDILIASKPNAYFSNYETQIGISYNDDLRTNVNVEYQTFLMHYIYIYDSAISNQVNFWHYSSRAKQWSRYSLESTVPFNFIFDPVTDGAVFDYFNSAYLTCNDVECVTDPPNPPPPPRPPPPPPSPSPPIPPSPPTPSYPPESPPLPYSPPPPTYPPPPDDVIYVPSGTILEAYSGDIFVNCSEVCIPPSNLDLVVWNPNIVVVGLTPNLYVRQNLVNTSNNTSNSLFAMETNDQIHNASILYVENTKTDMYFAARNENRTYSESINVDIDIYVFSNSSNTTYSGLTKINGPFNDSSRVYYFISQNDSVAWRTRNESNPVLRDFQTETGLQDEMYREDDRPPWEWDLDDYEEGEEVADPPDNFERDGGFQRFVTTRSTHRNYSIYGKYELAMLTAFATQVHGNTEVTSIVHEYTLNGSSLTNYSRMCVNATASGSIMYPCSAVTSIVSGGQESSVQEFRNPTMSFLFSVFPPPSLPPNQPPPASPPSPDPPPLPRFPLGPSPSPPSPKFPSGQAPPPSPPSPKFPSGQAPPPSPPLPKLPPSSPPFPPEKAPKPPPASPPFSPTPKLPPSLSPLLPPNILEDRRYLYWTFPLVLFGLVVCILMCAKLPALEIKYRKLNNQIVIKYEKDKNDSQKKMVSSKKY